jgi:antitoxin HicB
MIGASALGPRFREDDGKGDEMSHIYPVQLDPEEDGGYVVTLPDIGYGATQGDTFEEALRQAEDMLEEAILGMIAHSEEVPLPSLANERPVVRLPALTAAKLELYRAMREAGLDAAQLAHRLSWPPKKISNILDGYHAVRLEQLEAALAVLGRRLVVTSEPV